MLDAFYDIERGGASGLVRGHQHSALPVRADDVGLRRKTVADMGYFAHVDRCAVHAPDRQIVQARDGLRAAVHFHRVLQGPHFRRARGENQVLRVDRIHDVIRRKTLGLQCLRVDIHGNEPLFAAVREGQRRALHGRQLRANEIIPVVEQGLFAQGVAGQSDLDDRYG